MGAGLCNECAVDVVSSLTVGALLGLSAGFAPGPLLALVITQTLKHSVAEGIKVALAPLITDLPIIVLSLLLLARFANFKLVLGAVSFVGGLYILYLAYESVFWGTDRLDAAVVEPKSIRKGVLANALNPHPYLFWITVGAPLVMRAKAVSPVSPAAFVGFFYMFLVGSKVVLALVVGKSRIFLKSKWYLYIMRILAGALVCFAFLLLRDALSLLGVWILPKR